MVLRLAALLVCVGLLAPAGAGAVVQTVNFDNLGDNVTVADQYQPTFGLRFGRGPSGVTGVQPKTETPSPSSLAHSAPRVLDISTCVTSGEFQECDADLWLRLDKPQDTMSLRAGQTVGSGQQMTVRLFRADGVQITSFTQTLGAGVHTLINMSKSSGSFPCGPSEPNCHDGLPKIAFVRLQVNEMAGNGAHPIAIDDVSVDTGAPPAPADFGMTASPEGKIVVAAGQSRDVALKFGRFAGSSGPIALSVEGLPFGVSAAISPNPYTGGDGGAATVTLTTNASFANGYTGPFTIRAHPNGPGAGTADRSVVRTLVAQDTYDLKVVPPAVGQAFLSGTSLGPAGVDLPYDGPNLAARRTTVARLHVEATDGIPGGTPGVIAKMHGTRDGQPLPGSPLAPDRPALALNVLPFAQAGQPAEGFTFTLPKAWAEAGTIVLRGEVRGQGDDGGIIIGDDDRLHRECTGCQGNNSAALTGITFVKTAVPEIGAVELIWTRDGVTHRPGDPETLLADAWAATPVASHRKARYVGTLDISDIAGPKAEGDGGDAKNSAVLNRLKAWREDFADEETATNELGFMVMGFNEAIARGIASTQTPTAVVDRDSPLLSVAHELHHKLNREHASPGCDGGANGQVADLGWPTADGRLGTIGLDIRRRIGPADDDPYLIFDRTLGFDFMSYCAGASNSWVSARGWGQALTATVAGGKADDSSAGAASIRSADGHAHSSAVKRVKGSVVRLYGSVGPSGKVAFDETVPATGGFAAGASPYVAQALDRSGKVVSRSMLEADVTHHDPAPGHPGRPAILLDGAIQTKGIALGSVRVLKDGKVIGRLKASRRAPKVRVRTPKLSAKGKPPETITVRWRSSDPDSRRLRATVEISRDGGKRWRIVTSGPDRKKATFAAALLGVTKRAVVRVRISDGLNAATSRSKRFRARTPKPLATINEVG